VTIWWSGCWHGEGSTKPDDDHDGMQQKGENVAHAQDGIRPKKLKIQGACGIRHRQVVCSQKEKRDEKKIRKKDLAASALLEMPV
jgi:hypothetical protein